MREIEWKLISELMKNSRRSDRDLAKAIGSSQPTVSRIRKRLEKEGTIREYAMIPDFEKLGFEIMAFVFIRYKKEMTQEEYGKVKEAGKKHEHEFRTPSLLAFIGMGLGYDRVIVTFHENYSSYTQMVNKLRQLPFTPIDDIQSFLVSLKEREHYHPFTFSRIAEYLPSNK